MTVRLETVIKDSRTGRLLGLEKPCERFDADEGEVFLDGPACRRVAVLDFDPASGASSPPVLFRPPGPRRKIGACVVADPDDVHSVAMRKVSVFGTVLKAMERLLIASHLDRNPGVKMAGDSAEALIKRPAKAPDALRRDSPPSAPARASTATPRRPPCPTRRPWRGSADAARSPASKVSRRAAIWT